MEQRQRAIEIMRLIRNLNTRGIRLGEVLTELRFLYGCEYKEMASICGVTSARISNIRIENEKVSDSLYLSYLSKLDSVLKIDIEELKGQWE